MILPKSNIKNQISKSNTSGITSSKGQATSMAQLMSAFSSKVQPLKKGDIVEGTVKKLTPREITLDIGAKSDALVLEFDRKNVENLLKFLKVGDSVKASVLSPESEEGFPVVSLRRTLDDMIFLKLEDLAQKGEILTIHVYEGTRGGFFVETSEGVHGFLPNSQVLQEFNLIGKDIEVKIIELDRSKKRVIFSEKATHYLMDPAQIAKHVKVVEVIEVVIHHVTSHGIYTTLTLDKGVQIEGFIHISEVSYQRIEDLQKMFKTGDTIKAQVVDIDHEMRRLNLSIKRLEKDTFEEIQKTYKKDQTVKGVVRSVKSSGVTLELAPNVLGFIPEAKIPSQTAYKEGQEVEALVGDFDERHRMIILVPILKAKPIGYR